MEAEASCGAGIAENSVLPEKLADLLAALAGVLAQHTETLDLSDANARNERAAYQALLTTFEQTASTLRTLAGEMAGYRDLAPAVHDEALMAGFAPLSAFQKYVEAKRGLQALLEASAESDDEMLEEMHAAGG
jgi:hypothetical protein